MNHVSTLRLHQFRLGELAPAAAELVQAHLATCDTCAERLGHQREARIAFQREPVPAALLPSPTWTERLRSWWLAAAFVPVAAASLLVLGAPPPAELSAVAAADPAPDGVYTKGAHSRLEAWVQTGDSARPLYTGEHVRAGTRIQLKFDPGARRFVTLAGRDGTGAVEVYGTLTAAGPGLANAPFALTLDATRGEQAFFAVLTDTRPDPAWVTRLVHTDPVPSREADVATVFVQKE